MAPTRIQKLEQPAKEILSLAVLFGALLSPPSIAAGFNIAAPDATQTGLQFIFQGPESSSIGLDEENPFTVGGGEQTLDFFFEGQNNALLGTLRGAQLAVDVDFGGGSNTLDFLTQDNGLEVSAITLAVTGDGNTFNFIQEEGTLELREFEFNLELIGGANTFSLQSNDISQYAWEISGADNSFAVTQTETLITSQELSWRGDQGTATFDFTGASEIALATVVDGLRTTLTQRFESADQASVTTTLMGDDNSLALSAVNVSILNYLVAVNGTSNLLSLSAENATNARLVLEVLGNRNTISTLQRDVSDASIQVRLKGSDNQLTIEQSATPGL